MVKKAALYIRVSTDAQYEEGYSVDAQKEKLAQYCKLKDISDYEFYIDGGWSGSNIDRPEMKRLIGNITAGQINTVVVYKLDRLSRSQKDTVFLLEDVFIPNECSFISLNENFDTSTPYGKAMIGILSVFAQLERENIRERTRMGMYERVKSGLWMGGGRVPFGYDYDQNKNILVPNEHAKDVREIFDLYIQGYSLTQLADMFDVANDTHIAHILDRETYLGRINYNGEVFEGQHEAIIDEDTWLIAQEERRKRSVKSTTTSQYLLTGLVYCGKCGAKLRYQKWGNHLKMYCYSQQKSRPKLIKDPNCDNLRYNAPDVEKVIIDDLFRKTDSITQAGKQIDIKVSAANILKQKYDTLTAKIKRLYNLYAENEDELLLQTINENKSELNRISRALDDENKSREVVAVINEKNHLIRNLKNLWDSMSISEKQKALRLCIDRVEITDGEIKINYTF